MQLDDIDYTRSVVNHLRQYDDLSMAIGCGNIDDYGFNCKSRLSPEYDVTMVENSKDQVDKSDMSMPTLIVDINNPGTWTPLRPLLGKFKKIVFDRNSVYYFYNARFIKVIHKLLKPGGLFIFPTQINNSISLLTPDYNTIIMDGLEEIYKTHPDNGKIYRKLLLRPGQEKFYRNEYKSVTTHDPLIHIDNESGIITYLIDPATIKNYNIGLILKMAPFSSYHVDDKNAYFVS